jgi:hypothetical protein
MTGLVNRLGARFVDIWLPHLTADAISSMPAGCGPACSCSVKSGCTGDGCWYCCLNLACVVTCTCSASNGPCGRDGEYCFEQ